MNVSLSRLARLGGPLLSVALGMSSPLTVHAQDEGHYVLEKAVQVSRHGIRPQTDTAKLVEATQRQWPTWLVRDGELTGHGYLAASLMGAVARGLARVRPGWLSLAWAPCLARRRALPMCWACTPCCPWSPTTAC